MTNHPFITILTPTYNRKDQLPALYHSLQAQTAPKDSFLWLIADDGSTDGTEELVRKWQQEQKKGMQQNAGSAQEQTDITQKQADITQEQATMQEQTASAQNMQISGVRIQYLSMENGGKHRAMNRAMQEVTTPLVFPVDSDDALTPDAVETVQKAAKNAKEPESTASLCGFSFQRVQPDGTWMSGAVSEDGVYSTYCQERINRNNLGDMAEVWVSDVLRQYPFPEFEGEKFLGEDTVWVTMSGEHPMRFCNKAIYCSEYLEEGLTNNRRRHNLQSPMGCTKRAEVFLNASQIKWIYKIKPAMQYWIYGHVAGTTRQELMRKRPKGSGALLLVTFLPAVILEHQWVKR